MYQKLLSVPMAFKSLIVFRVGYPTHSVFRYSLQFFMFRQPRDAIMLMPPPNKT